MRRAVLPRSSGMALVLLAVAGCGDRLPPLPNLIGVTPASGLVDQTVSVQVEGDGFAVRVITDFNDQNQSHTDDTYLVTIGGIALTGVQHLSATQLNGTLPPGVAEGGNDLQVTDPWGRSVTKAAAYFGIPIGGEPTQLAITGPTNVPIGTCQAVTVEQRNAGGAATVSLTATAVTLATTPAGSFDVFVDSGCATATTSATIDVGQTAVTVYVRAADRAPSSSLDASATGLTSASHGFVFGPTQLSFTSGSVTGLVGQCAGGTLTVETQDPAGLTSAVATATTVTLGAPVSLLLYDGALCMGSTVTTITIPAGGSSASFSVKGIVAGSPVVTVSSAGLAGASQMETINPTTNFVFGTLGAQGVANPFLLFIRTDDGVGNVVTTFNGTAALSGQGGPTVTCLSNCTNGTTTGAFLRGRWSGWVKASSAASNAAIHAVSGTITGDSNAFNVLVPGSGISAPIARLSVTPGAVDSTSTMVMLNAGMSSGYGGALEYSFDTQGITSNPPGTTPWSNWSPTITTATGSGYTAGVWYPRVAVRWTGDTVYSIATATVVSTSNLLCTVTTAVLNDDGASNCTMTNKYGTDMKISLPEAIKLTNGGGGRVITADQAYRFIFNPGDDNPVVSNSTSLSFPTGTQLVDLPLSTTGSGILLANVEITGTSTWAVGGAGGSLTIQDSVVHDHAGILANASLALQRVQMLRCPAGAPCVNATGPNGLVRALFSEFMDAPGDALRIHPATVGGPCPVTAVDVQSSTFTRASIGINDDCTSGSHVVHATFHGNGTGIEYVGGSANELRNNIFSNNTTATACAAATFANGKDYNLLFGNGTDGCVAGDANTPSGDPLYFVPEAGDFRIRSTSPAYDSATNLSLDVNDVGPGSFYGAGPDRGGRETP